MNKGMVVDEIEDKYVGNDKQTHLIIKGRGELKLVWSKGVYYFKEPGYVNKWRRRIEQIVWRSDSLEHIQRWSEKLYDGRKIFPPPPSHRGIDD